jgi:hypothetical protein
MVSVHDNVHQELEHTESSGQLLTEIGLKERVEDKNKEREEGKDEEGEENEGDELDDEEKDDKLISTQPDPYINFEAIKYAKLQTVIDKLVASNEMNLLGDSMQVMNTNVERLVTLRAQLTLNLKRRSDGMRLATDIRTFISKNTIQSLTSLLGMVVIET